MPRRFDLDFPTPPPMRPMRGPARALWILSGTTVVLAVAVVVLLVKVSSDATDRRSRPSPAGAGVRRGFHPAPFAPRPGGASTAPSGIRVGMLDNGGRVAGSRQILPSGAANQSFGQPSAQFGGLSQAAAIAPQDVIARTKLSVVLVLVSSPSSFGSGSGFVVGPNQIATCAHVVDDAREIVVVAPSGARFPARPWLADSANDVAIITTAAGILPAALPLAPAGVGREGDEVAVTGYPEVFSMLAEGFTPLGSTTRGTVSSRRVRQTASGAVEVIQIDAAVNSGNSGGPLYSLRDGSVFGVAKSTLSGAQGLHFAAPIGPLVRLLGR